MVTVLTRLILLIISALCFFVLTGCGSDNEDLSADLIVVNANVITMDDKQPYVSALAVRGGRFLEIGNDEDIERLAGPSTQVINANGKTIVPGFNDAHLHALAIPEGAISLADTSDIEGAIALMNREAKPAGNTPWRIGYSYDDTLWGRHPTKADLDKVSTEEPVMLWHASMHLYVVNSVALNNAGITNEIEDPAGGKFYRDASGELTGLLGERVALDALFTDLQPIPLASDLSSAQEALAAFYDKALSYGITSFSDALVPPELAIIYYLSAPDEAGVRVNLMYDGTRYGQVKWLERITWVTSVVGWRPFDTPWLRGRTIKVFHGNSLSGRTARLYEPYTNPPDYYGEMPERSQEELNAFVREIARDGYQVAVHSNGDYEIDMVLDAIEFAYEKDGLTFGHRLEHGSVVNDAILKRIRKLDIIMAPHSYIYEKGTMIEAFGERRWDTMFANASIFELGIPNAGNSDFPVSSLNPMLRIQSLVTRRSKQGKVYGESQRLDVEQALYAYTMGGAIGSLEEDVKGSISPNKYADFIVLSEDPRSTPPDRIKDIQIDQTYSNGVLRYQRE